jgi:hypothetical protein
MRIHKFLPLVAILCLCAGAAFAGPVSGGGPDHDVAAAPVSKALLDAHEAPIVSGRSVSAHHKSRMHHVRSNPDGLSDEPLADEIAPSSE